MLPTSTSRAYETCMGRRKALIPPLGRIGVQPHFQGRMKQLLRRMKGTYSLFSCMKGPTGRIRLHHGRRKLLLPSLGHMKDAMGVGSLTQEV